MGVGVLLAGAVALVVALLAGGSDEPPPEAPPSSVPESRPGTTDAPPAPGKAPDRTDEPDPDPDPKADEVPEGPSGPAPSSDPERQAAAVLRAYVRAMNAGNGARLCRLFEPGALDGFDFPRDRGSCARSAEASLGYRDPRGLPEWRRSEVTDAVSAEVTGDAARVVATVFTIYRDVREPSIEDDILYLRADGGRWLIVKPSATLYRAVGIADVPPSVISPP